MITEYDVKKIVQSTLWHLMLDSCNYKSYRPVAELMCNIAYNMIIGGEY